MQLCMGTQWENQVWSGVSGVVRVRVAALSRSFLCSSVASRPPGIVGWDWGV
jgi:hypothetical protein